MRIGIIRGIVKRFCLEFWREITHRMSSPTNFYRQIYLMCIRSCMILCEWSSNIFVLFVLTRCSSRTSRSHLLGTRIFLPTKVRSLFSYVSDSTPFLSPSSFFLFFFFFYSLIFFCLLFFLFFQCITKVVQIESAFNRLRDPTSTMVCSAFSLSMSMRFWSFTF